MTDEPRFDAATALVVVDVQNDFADPAGGLYVEGGEQVVPLVSQLVGAAQNVGAVVVYTQDWHPDETPHFADFGGLWPVHCVQGTRGAELHESLDPGSIAAVFRKGMDPAVDSYSGFFDNGHKAATGLGDWLTAKQITQLYVLGLATDYCVKFTVLDARQLGFEVWLVEDGCRAVELTRGDEERAIAAMRDAGATILTSGSI